MFTVVRKLIIDGDAKTAVVEDTTAYEPTISFSDVDVQGTFTVVGPDGVAVITNGNIDLSGGDTESAPFNLPLDVNGEILNGTYTLTYFPTFTVTNFAIAGFNSGTDAVTIASVDWVNIFNEPGVTNEVTTSGATAPADNGTFDVVSVSLVGSDTAIVLDTSLTTESPTAATISFEVEYLPVTSIYTFTGCDEVTPTATVTSYCNTTQFGQIIFQDTTILPATQVLNARSGSITYPGNLTNPDTPAPVSWTLPSVTINTLATGAWTWMLTYDVTVTQDDGLVYTYTSSGSSISPGVVVTCTTLCSLRCGIDKLIQQTALAVNGGAAINPLSKPMYLVELYFIGATLAQECGNQTKYDEYAALIQEQISLAGIDCGCGCSDETTETGNHWINNAGFESQTQIAILIADVDALEVDMATVQADIAALQVDYQIFTAFAETNVTGSQPNSLSIPAQFFGTFQGTSGYVHIKFSVYDPFAATITIRDVTTGVDVFSYSLAPTTLVTFDLLLMNDGANTFNLFGTRLTSAPAYAFVNQSAIPGTTVVPNAVNILKFNSTTGTTIWMTAEITGIKQ